MDTIEEGDIFMGFSSYHDSYETQLRSNRTNHEGLQYFDINGKDGEGKFDGQILHVLELTSKLSLENGVT